MFKISNQVTIEEGELTFAFIRSSGPGGQNVNKVATAVQLRFDVLHSPSLTDEVKSRLVRLAGRRMTVDGSLLIEAKRYRTQEQNKEDAIGRLTNLIQKAVIKPKKRIHTRPSRSAKEKRLKEKKKKGEIKKYRRNSTFE
jgi:ribosome-associated protein